MGKCSLYFRPPCALWCPGILLGSNIKYWRSVRNSWRRCCVQSLSRVRLFSAPQMVAHQAPLPMEFSRQEYWRGLPFPPPGDLPNPGIELESLVPPALAGKVFTTVPPRKPNIYLNFIENSLHKWLSVSTSSISANSINCELKRKKKPESSKKQNLNLPWTYKYLHSIYIVFIIIT